MVSLQSQQPPVFFVRGPSPLARMAFFGSLSIALMAADSRLHMLNEIRQGFSALLHPLEALASAPVGAIRGVDEYFTWQSKLTQENAELRRQALFHGVELQRLNALQAENDHLRRLLESQQILPKGAQMAEVMHVGRDPFIRKVIVNLGSHHGILAGQAAVDADGVIGQVTRVAPFSSEVTLITDQDLAVPIQIERNGLRAIAFGFGRDGTLDLPFLPANVDIREGDALVTSGIDGIYPSGLAVAKVLRVERSPGTPFARIVCLPTAGIETHRQMLLLPLISLPPLPQDEAKSAQSPTRHAARQP